MGVLIEGTREIMRFSGRGKVESYTIIPDGDHAPAGFEYLAPYAVAWVRLEEGPLVTAMLTDINLKDIQIGLEVEMVTRKKRDLGDRGVIVYGPSFRPPIPESTEALVETMERIMAEPETCYKIGCGLVPKEGLAWN